MNKILKFAAAFLLISTPAMAAVNVTIVPSAFGVQGGGAGFESQSIAPLSNPYIEAGLTFSTFSGTVQVMNTTNGQGAFPAGNTSTRYLSVLGGGSVDITPVVASNRLQLYWGSVDAYNSIDFWSGGSVVASLTGSDLTPLLANGNQVSQLSNRLVSVFLTNNLTYDFARLSSSGNSFEVDNISAAVPEPATWAMMLFGFGALGVLSARRSRRLTVVNA